MKRMMRAAVLVEPGRIEIEDKHIPDVGPNDALMRITTTTICGTDVHILKGAHPVARGLTIGHEPVGVIMKLGDQVTGYEVGQRMIARGTAVSQEQQSAHALVPEGGRRRSWRSCVRGRPCSAHRPRNN